MIHLILQKVFGTHHDRERKRLWPVVERINALEPEMHALSDAALRAKTDEFKTRVQRELSERTFPDPSSPEWYEISPDDRRPAYSGYFNALASPAALLPLAGAAIVDAFSLEAVFSAAAFAAVVQLGFHARLSRLELT